MTLLASNTFSLPHIIVETGIAMPTKDELQNWHWSHRMRLTRRSFLVLASSYVVTAVVVSCGGEDRDGDLGVMPSPSPGTGDETTPVSGGTPSPDGMALTLDQFMRLSRILTAFDDLDDTASGQLYLNAIVAQPGIGARLSDLWLAGGFADGSPPLTVDDLAARGVFEDTDLASLADSITETWYSGTYTSAAEQTVVTYTNALAWRTLGYRASGPSSCGGAFAYWTSAPAT